MGASLEAEYGYQETDEEKRLGILLENWGAWCGRGQWVEAYPSVASPFCTRSSLDFETMCEDMDTQLAEIVDAAFWSLIPNHQAALSHKYTGAAIWRFPRLHYPTLLQEAKEAIGILLVGRGIL